MIDDLDRQFNQMFEDKHGSTPAAERYKKAPVIPIEDKNDPEPPSPSALDSGLGIWKGKQTWVEAPWSQEAGRSCQERQDGFQRDSGGEGIDAGVCEEGRANI